MDTQARASERSHSHMHARTHTHKHTRTHKHARTHTRTQLFITLPYIRAYKLLTNLKLLTADGYFVQKNLLLHQQPAQYHCLLHVDFQRLVQLSSDPQNQLAADFHSLHLVTACKQAPCQKCYSIQNVNMISLLIHYPALSFLICSNDAC